MDKHLKTIKWLVLCVMIMITSGTQAATFKGGEDKTIDTPLEDNLYIASGTLTVDATIDGDLIAAAGKITVNDTIFEDLTAAGADILINAIIGEDAKIAGENITILRSINGDLIVFGANIEVGREVIVAGDLMVCGGRVVVKGIVNGDVKIMGGTVTFNGEAQGETDIEADVLNIGGKFRKSSVIAANKINFEDKAEFHDGLEYWQQTGETDLSNYMVNGLAIFSPDLELYQEVTNWKYLGFGLATFAIIYTFSIVLTIFLLTILFGKVFSKAGKLINESYIKNFGYGLLYFISLPLTALFFFLILIGIPIGLVLLHVFLFSLLFAYSITSIILAYGINIQYKKNWGKWKIMGVALLIFAVLKLITGIPFLGLLMIIIVVGMAFGTLISQYLPWEKTSIES
ncbi:MAG: hypothetical protein ABJH72_05420 [Reichenbachiella sp.]|uniref:hypothetical protein n=1 Tax=Reichenbachiella sp. TaxID=2184521 RepID=UPI0032983454